MTQRWILPEHKRHNDDMHLLVSTYKSYKSYNTATSFWEQLINQRVQRRMV